MVSQSGESLAGNAGFEGYAIDLISEIAQILSKYKRISGYPVVYISTWVSGDVQQVAGFEGYAIYLISEIAQILSKYDRKNFRISGSIF